MTCRTAGRQSALFVFLIIAALATVHTYAQAVKSNEKAAESAKAQSPPAIEFQAQPVSDRVGIGDKIRIFVTISNKSAVEIRDLKLSSPETVFPVEDGPVLPDLAAYRNTSVYLTLIVGKEAGFGQFKVPVILSYSYNSPKPEASPSPSTGKSPPRAQTSPAEPSSAAINTQSAASVTVNVIRSFDEESKAFPGGTAAVLYLLLPIIPAMLSFQFVNNLRKGLGAQMPGFKSEHLVPAFLIAVALSFLMLLAFNLDLRLNYSDPRLFLGTLAASAFSGAVIPGFLWMRGAFNMRRWGFRESDPLDEYLRKALKSPHPAGFRWTTGTIQGESYEGLALVQPTGKRVFGITLTAVPNVNQTKDPAEYKRCYETLHDSVFKDDVLVDKAELLRMAGAGEIKLESRDSVKLDGIAAAGPVIFAAVGEFEKTGPAKLRALVVPST